MLTSVDTVLLHIKLACIAFIRSRVECHLLIRGIRQLDGGGRLVHLHLEVFGALKHGFLFCKQLLGTQQRSFEFVSLQLVLHVVTLVEFLKNRVFLLREGKAAEVWSCSFHQRCEQRRLLRPVQCFEYVFWKDGFLAMLSAYGVGTRR